METQGQMAIIENIYSFFFLKQGKKSLYFIVIFPILFHSF